jgi:hypothetical protein
MWTTGRFNLPESSQASLPFFDLPLQEQFRLALHSPYSDNLEIDETG